MIFTPAGLNKVLSGGNHSRLHETPRHRAVIIVSKAAAVVRSTDDERVTDEEPPLITSSDLPAAQSVCRYVVCRHCCR